MTAQASGELVSLPTGGGAVRGVGETFQPDLHTGTGNFSIPIDVPSGRNGFQPQLALSYSTGSGNGPFGLGWSVDVPGVRRKTARGIPRYDGNDVFVLSGAEDLVPVPGGAVGRQRYRPRAEGLFARVERHTHDGQDYWEVWSKGGIRSRYGSVRPFGAASTWRDPAAIHDPADARRIQGWLLTATTDLVGNEIRYSYRRDEEEPNGAQRYLSEIRYVDYGDAADPDFLVRIQFHYQHRPDPFSDRRGGFEVRTGLRCERIETWTYAGEATRCRSINLRYADQVGRRPANGVSLLTRVLVAGHDGDTTQSLPPVDLGYTEWTPERRRYQAFSAPGDEVPTVSLANRQTDLVDLFGEGLPSVVEMNGTARYWRNLGQARFDRPRPMAFVPAGASLGSPGVQLADLDGDGRTDLLVTDGTRAGYYRVARDGGFDPAGHVAYRQGPAVDLTDPEVRLLDLDGNGAMDALRTGDGIELYYNDPLTGWSDAVVVRRPADFPASLSDPRVKLADMTGDGLTDVVLVEDGRVQYWPYLGYGRWGAVVTVQNAPRFGESSDWGAGRYDPRRLLIGDIDGDGRADLVYVGDGDVTVWVNRGGTAFAAPDVVRGTPSIDGNGNAQLADMLGTGTAGILWSFDSGSQRESTYKFLDLTGEIKPYLLSTIDNHTGGQTTIEYSTSTRHALDDARDGRPWRTTLPFPVHVVARTTVVEHFCGTRMTSTFRYHHGYWDGAEREFRGFARVDQHDALSYPSASAASSRYSPPTEIRTWFHMGPVGPEFGAWEVLDLADEHWAGDRALLGPTDTTGLPAALPRRARRDAIRALAGRVLRSELYGRDGDVRQERPYTVTEHRYGLSPVLDGRAGTDNGWLSRPVFFPHAKAERTTQWERGDDPLTTATFTDGYDGYGRAAQTVQLAVPRGRDPRSAAPAGEPYLATTTMLRYATRDDAGRYVIDRVASTTRHELVNDGTLTLANLHLGAVDGTVGRQLRHLEVTYYDGPAFEGLGFGELGDHGLAVRTEQLAFTPEMLPRLCPDGAPPYLIDPPAAWPSEYPPAFRAAFSGGVGYRRHEAGAGRVAGYYVQAQRARFDVHDDPVGGRGLVVARRDPLGNETTTTYDAYGLLPVEVVDAVGLRRRANYDYRVLAPRLVTDVNDNRTQVGYTPLGLLAWSARTGKEGAQEGDTPEKPGVVHEYGLSAWDDSAGRLRQPSWVRTVTRTEHRWTIVDQERKRRADKGLPPLTQADIAALFPADEASRHPERFLTKLEYTDGLGRQLQTRVQWDTVVLDDLGLPPDVALAPGDAVAREAGDVPSVAVSGWKAYDNKGQVVEAWEPFLDSGWAYEAPQEEQLAHELASTVTQYDARSQVVRVVHADASEERVVRGVPFDVREPAVFSPTPWVSFSYDANDNAGRTHRDTSGAWSTHWDTPSSALVDALGRTVESVVRTGTGEQVDRTVYDIDGRMLETFDALGRSSSRSAYDLLGRVWVNELIDAGRVLQVLNAAGVAVERRDGKGALTLAEQDLLGRTVRSWARDRAGDAVTLRGVVLFGDDAASGLGRTDAAAANLLARTYKNYDEAGLVTTTRFDADGNPLERERRVLRTDVVLSRLPAAGGDWSATAYRVDWEPPTGTTLDQRAQALLDATPYGTSNRYDALGRRTAFQLPVDVEGRRRSVVATYGRSGNLTGVQLDGVPYVTRILYNARGQRSLALLGNGVMVRYAYDPQTFRPARLRSDRYQTVSPWRWRAVAGGGGPLQDHGYRYDQVGNLVALADRTPGCGVPPSDANQLDRNFTCDPLYRLIAATGRECEVAPSAPWSISPRCTDVNATRAYRESYSYDAVGNLVRLGHDAGTGSWVQQVTLTAGSNTLTRVTSGSTAFDYAYDWCGNLTQEATSRYYEWDAGNQLAVFRVQAAASDPSLYAQYRYGAGGQRVLKVVRDQSWNTLTTVYVEGVFERLVVKQASTQATTTHDTAHVLDGTTRVAVVRIGLAAPGDTVPGVVYHLADHLDSSEAVTDAAGAIVNREEFTPYGQTSFGSYARKRYRFTGKERDEESGLNYHGARYYAPWLCRWISRDPVPAASGNAYAYVSANPARLVDRTGAWGEEGHYYTVYLVALAAGFPSRYAFQAAFFAQLPDEVKALEAKPAGFRVANPYPYGDLFGGSNISRADIPIIQGGGHALTGGSSAAEQQFRYEQSSQYSPLSYVFGLSLHPFGDAYSHQVLGESGEGHMYPGPVGHGLAGHTPDIIGPARREQYGAYVGDLYRVMRRESDKLGFGWKPRMGQGDLLRFASTLPDVPKGSSQIGLMRKTAEAMGQPMLPYAPERQESSGPSEFANNVRLSSEEKSALPFDPSSRSDLDTWIGASRALFGEWWQARSKQPDVSGLK